MYVLMVVLVVVAQCCCGGVNAGEMDHAITVKSSVNNTTKIENNGILKVPLEECGFILCNASAVSESFAPNNHYWDFYVHWELPTEDKAIFQMGSDYQMPHAYLVFRHFKSTLTGKYQCHLSFRGTPVGSHVVHLSLDESTHASRICPH